MPYILTFARTQMMMCSWNFFLDSESIARIIDAFVNSLDLKKYGVKEAATEGMPSYDPKGMYKLFRIKWLNAHTDEYLRILKDIDEQKDLNDDSENLTRKVIAAKLKEAQERLARYEAYQKQMEESGVAQLSL